MTITGYKYLSENDAIAAINAVDAAMGFVHIEGNVTNHYCDYSYSPLDGFWYIVAIEELLPILGEPETFEITTEEL